MASATRAGLTPAPTPTGELNTGRKGYIALNKNNGLAMMQLHRPDQKKFKKGIK